MDSLIIRKAEISDLNLLVEVSKTTFVDTFAESNSEENIKSYLNANITNDKLLTELSNENSFFYFIYEGNTIAGYLKLNVGEAQSENFSQSSLEIERIYVLKPFHGKGVGKALLNKAVEVATQLGKAQIWLGVWEMNTKAIEFYERNNFIRFDKHVFVLGNDEQTDYLYKLDLPK